MRLLVRSDRLLAPVAMGALVVGAEGGLMPRTLVVESPIVLPA
jgi:hypothetical protein